jgi:hypothetical protein
MKLSIVEPESGKMTMVLMEHAGEQMVWSTNTYERTSFHNINTFFDDINRYWASLDAKTQLGIWNTYQEMLWTMNNVSTLIQLHFKMRDLTKQLYEYHDLEELKRSVLFYGDVKIPATMKTEYGPKDIEPRTYLRDDYLDLVIFTIALRPMVPVFGEYIDRVKKEVGSTQKEHQAMGILSTSKLYETPAMKRLRVYVYSSVEYEDVSISAVLDGLGSDELPEWLLNRSIIRKVLVGEVNVPGDKSTIISNIYNFIISNNRSMDRNFKGKVTDKRQPKDGADEDNISLVETYKVKQEVSDGAIVLASVYTERTMEMATRVDPEADLRLVQLALNEACRQEFLQIMTHHITLTQWVMNKAISARSIPSLNKPALLRAMGVTQGLLWSWGFKELALLMTASPVIENDDDLIGTVESRTRIPKDYLDKLVEKYPYYQRTSSKMQNERQSNVGAKAIDTLAKEIYQHDWVVTGPKVLVKEVLPTGTDVFIAPPDIKSQLAQLLLRV